VPGDSTFPLWVVALIVAAVAPWCARALQVTLERRVRRRTLDTIAQARDEADKGSP
jgi:hypothetical protein